MRAFTVIRRPLSVPTCTRVIVVALRIGVDIEHVRVQKDAHPRGAPQFLAIHLAEAHRRAELRNGVAHVARCRAVGGARRSGQSRAPSMRGRSSVDRASVIHACARSTARVLRVRMASRYAESSRASSKSTDRADGTSRPSSGCCRRNSGCASRPRIDTAVRHFRRGTRSRVSSSGANPPLSSRQVSTRRPTFRVRALMPATPPPIMRDRRFDDRILFDIASIDEHPQLPCSSS